MENVSPLVEAVSANLVAATPAKAAEGEPKPAVMNRKQRRAAKKALAASASAVVNDNSVASKDALPAPGAKGKSLPMKKVKQLPPIPKLGPAEISVSEPIPAAEPKKRDLREWLRLTEEFAVDVVQDSAEQAHAEAMNWNFKPGNGHGMNPHGIAAMERSKALNFVLGHAASRGHITVADCWGHYRTATRAEAFHKLWSDFPLVVNVYGKNIVPADVYRRPDSFELPVKADCVFLNDVYDLPTGDCSPMAIRDIMARTGASCVYWSGHRFPDAMGMLAVTGTYVRVDSTSVISRASPYDKEYGPHYDCAWNLQDGSVDGVMWTLLKSYGDHHVFCFVLGTSAVHSLPMPSKVHWTYVDLPDLKDPFTRRIVDWLPPGLFRLLHELGYTKLQPMLVDTQLVNKVRGHIRAVRITSFSYKTLSNLIENEIKAEPWKTIFSCFPAHQEAFVRSSLLYTMTHIAIEETCDLYVMNTLYGDSLAVRSHELAAMGTDPKRSSSRWLLGLGFGGAASTLFLLALLALRRRFAAPAQVSFDLPLLDKFRVLVGLKTPQQARFDLIWKNLGSVFIAIASVSPHLRRVVGLVSWVKSGFGQIKQLIPGAWLAPKKPILSAVGEEFLRFGAIEQFGDIGNIVATLLNVFAEPKAYYLHLFCGALALHSPFLAACVHVLNNAYARPIVDDFQWRSYVAAVLEAPIEDLEPYVSDTVAHSLIRDSRVRDRVDARVSAPTSVNVVYKSGARELLGLQPAVESFHYVLIGHDAPYYVPGNSGAVRVACVDRRLCAATLWEVPGKKQVIARAWGHWRQVFVSTVKNWLVVNEPLAITPIIRDDALIKQWVDHLPAHNRSKLIKALELILESPVVATPVELNLKRNEKLFKLNDAGALDPVARSIHAVKPKMIAYTGPVVFEVTSRMKFVWSGEQDYPWICFDGVRFRFIMGPMSDVALANLIARFVQIAQHSDDGKDEFITCIIIVAGDDSLVMFYYLGIWHVIEGDFSKFDPTQLLPSLRLTYDLFCVFGAPIEIVGALRDTACQPLVMGVRGTTLTAVIVRPEGTRDTGGADTSPGNSSTTLAVLAKALSSWDRVTPPALWFQESAANFGLVLKCKHSSSISWFEALNGHTFLKHAFWPIVNRVTHEISLAPVKLPSQILKIGISLRDPCAVYRCDDPDLAALFHLNDQACGLANCFLPPILRRFCELFGGLRLPPHDRILDPEDRYRLGAASWDEQLYGSRKSDWYVDDLSVCLVKRYGDLALRTPLIEDLLIAVPRQFVQHPLFAQMAKVDYN